MSKNADNFHARPMLSLNSAFSKYIIKMKPARLVFNNGWDECVMRLKVFTVVSCHFLHLCQLEVQYNFVKYESDSWGVGTNIVWCDLLSDKM